MDYSLQPNAMVSIDFSPLSNIHKSVQRNSRTSKRKIRMDINRNATQAFLETGRDFNTLSPFQGFPSQNGPAAGNGGSDDESFMVPAFEIVSEERRQNVSSGSTHIWQFIYVILIIT